PCHGEWASNPSRPRRRPGPPPPRHYNYACAEAVVTGADPITITKMASIAKLKTGRLHREVADWCMQLSGGIGYMEETWTARFYRDSRLLSIGGGSDEMMLRIIAQ